MQSLQKELDSIRIELAATKKNFERSQMETAVAHQQINVIRKQATVEIENLKKTSSTTCSAQVWARKI